MIQTSLLVLVNAYYAVYPSKSNDVFGKAMGFIQAVCSVGLQPHSTAQVTISFFARRI